MLRVITLKLFSPEQADILKPSLSIDDTDDEGYFKVVVNGQGSANDQDSEMNEALDPDNNKRRNERCDTS